MHNFDYWSARRYKILRFFKYYQRPTRHVTFKAQEIHHVFIGGIQAAAQGRLEDDA